MQAQVPTSPYVGLWSRLSGFQLEDLSSLVERRRVVRLALMRSTIHLVSARDCLWLRPVVQPVLDRGLLGSFGKHLRGLDLDAVTSASREIFAEEPCTLAAASVRLGRCWPERNAQSLGQVARARLPLVQIPPRGLWGQSGSPVLAHAETWLRRPLAARPSCARMLQRYLRAFGPATIRDMQAWSGLTGLHDTVERSPKAASRLSRRRGSGAVRSGRCAETARRHASAATLSSGVRQPSSVPCKSHARRATGASSPGVGRQNAARHGAHRWICRRALEDRSGSPLGDDRHPTLRQAVGRRAHRPSRRRRTLVGFRRRRCRVSRRRDPPRQHEMSEWRDRTLLCGACSTDIPSWWCILPQERAVAPVRDRADPDSRHLRDRGDGSRRHDPEALRPGLLGDQATLGSARAGSQGGRLARAADPRIASDINVFRKRFTGCVSREGRGHARTARRAADHADGRGEPAAPGPRIARTVRYAHDRACL